MTSTPLERTVRRAAPWLLGGLLAALPLLAVPSPGPKPFATFLVLLAFLVALGLVLTAITVPEVDDPGWWSEVGSGRRVRRLLAGVAVTVVVTGVIGLVSLATAAALRFDASLQYLMLLSALDIAWSVTALVIGVRWLWGDRSAAGAGSMLAVICVFSIWNYLRVVGFGAHGEWVVDGGRLVTLVLPFDTAAAVMAIGALLAGARRQGRAIEHPSPQS